jgi:hypothetical protein
MESLGAAVSVAGDDAAGTARAYAAAHPGCVLANNRPAVAEGAGTIGLELLSDGSSRYRGPSGQRRRPDHRGRPLDQGALTRHPNHWRLPRRRPVDGLTAAAIAEGAGLPWFLDELRAQLKTGAFRPLPMKGDNARPRLTAGTVERPLRGDVHSASRLGKRTESNPAPRPRPAQPRITRRRGLSHDCLRSGLEAARQPRQPIDRS